MGGDGAGEEQEDTNKRELHADQGEAFMDDQAENDEPNPGRIHHADGMGAAEQVGKPHKADGASDQRDDAGGDAKTGKDVDGRIHHLPSSPGGNSGRARPPLSPRPPVSKSLRTAKVPMKLMMA